MLLKRYEKLGLSNHILFQLAGTSVLYGTLINQERLSLAPRSHQLLIVKRLPLSTLFYVSFLR